MRCSLRPSSSAHTAHCIDPSASSIELRSTAAVLPLLEADLAKPWAAQFSPPTPRRCREPRPVAKAWLLAPRSRRISESSLGEAWRFGAVDWVSAGARVLAETISAGLGARGGLELVRGRDITWRDAQGAKLADRVALLTSSARLAQGSVPPKRRHHVVGRWRGRVPWSSPHVFCDNLGLTLAIAKGRGRGEGGSPTRRAAR